MLLFWIGCKKRALRRHFYGTRILHRLDEVQKPQRAGRRTIGLQGVCPSMCSGISWYHNRFQSSRHVYKIWVHSVLFEGPLDLHNFGSVWKDLAVAGHHPKRVYHHITRRDHFQADFGLTYRNILPSFARDLKSEDEPNGRIDCVAIEESVS